MVLEILVDVERVEVFAVEAGQEHVDDDRDVDLFAPFFGRSALGNCWSLIRFWTSW